MPPRAKSAQVPNAAMSASSKAGPSKKPDTGHDSDFEMDDTMSVKTLSSTASIDNSTPAVAALPHPKGKTKEEELDYSDVAVADRLPSGFYHSVDSRLEAAGKNALSNVDPDSDLQFDKDKRIFHFQSNTKTQEASFIFAGDLIDMTTIRPNGNKPMGTAIGDKTNVRHPLTIQRLAHWDPEQLNGSDPFQDAVWATHQMMVMGEGGQDAFIAAVQRDKTDPKFTLKAPFKKSAPDVAEYDQIAVVTDMAYAKPSTTAIDLQVSRSPSKRKAAGDTEVAQAPSQTAVPDGTPRVGDLYDPKLMPGYKGSDFAHVDAKLVQLDIRDANGKLLFPWQWGDYIQPGAMVLVRARLKKWVVLPTDKNSYIRSHIYQWVADSVRILAKGPERPKGPEGKSEVDLKDPNVVFLEDYDVMDSFSIGSPAKKSKLA
ncbi:hypothetical protein EXIGLDRAFT_780978 [Exidia glandulosa HHB12029]|uniref:Uncharacterized protein n=1 Tax=Exidia glandulosa HHB12029 TaxID=1314781 RepID=A0A165Z8W0_EXIGL|nr:hypothetical protein EXIGLDRAFT_780978 [Exidia glandulosa HHB12029]